MRQALADAGFDLVHEVDTAAIARELALPWLADPARRRGVVVGNTRALWPKFLAARRTDPELAAAPDPLDRYTERTLARVFAGDRVWLAHARYDGAWIPIQRIAAAAGLGHVAPTGLVIHPTFGPWIALRAVVTLPGEPPPRRAPARPPCRCGEACQRAFARAAETCAADDWIAVRDACPVGRAHRYGDDQLRYHYTKDRALLG
jgi:methylmalonic aciduria homocystinuria type C protein